MDIFGKSLFCLPQVEAGGQVMWGVEEGDSQAGPGFRKETAGYAILSAA